MAGRTSVPTALPGLPCHAGGFTWQAAAHVRLLPLSAPRPRCRVVPPCWSARPAGAGGAPSHGHAKLHVVCSPADGRSGRLQFEVTIDRTATDARAQVCEWARAPGWRWGPQGARVPDRTLARRLPPRPRATPGGAPPSSPPSVAVR